MQWRNAAKRAIIPEGEGIAPGNDGIAIGGKGAACARRAVAPGNDDVAPDRRALAPDHHALAPGDDDTRIGNDDSPSEFAPLCALNSRADFVDGRCMFTAYARHSGNGQHSEAQCATLEEALTHLREIITNEIADPEGPLFWTYGIEFDPSMAAAKRPTEYHFPKVCNLGSPAVQHRRSPRKSRRAIDEADQRCGTTSPELMRQ